MLLKNRRIFILEDDATNLAIMSVMLRDQGAIIRFERWGVDTCRDLLNFVPIDLILLDLMLPNNISGYDVYDRIRALPEFDKVPIVLVTAADPDREMKKAREKGFNGFIGKPIRLGSFSRLVLKVIEGRPVWGS